MTKISEMERINEFLRIMAELVGPIVNDNFPLFVAAVSKNEKNLEEINGPYAYSSCLFVACLFGSKEIAKLLIDERETLGIDLNKPDKFFPLFERRTFLSGALGHNEIYKMLKDAGAEI